jgi:TP901 family phage tail tape measure protein
MAINGGNIQFGVSYKVDESGLNNIKKQLTDLSNMQPGDFLNINQKTFTNINEANTKLKEVKGVVQEVQTAYDGAFDSTTGVVNVNKLSQSLKNIGVDKIKNSFSQMGVEGVKAWNNITSQVIKANLKFRETNDFVKKIGTTLTNTLGWSLSSSLINRFTGSVQQAWGYVQHLDTSLNDIRIVTGKSADEMDKFAEKANNAAKALGSSTTEYTETALIYYQQGLSDEESQARAETTLKAANVTGQSGQAVSEQLTAVWNGYKVTAEETELYVDKLAAVAASTAADLEELSTGMSKVASAANNMGVDIDQLNAQLATIVSVTRQAPETAGTALKTIYARMEDLKIGGEDESGVKLGEVSSTLEEVGISVMDTSGDLRDLGEVIEEVAGKWDTWTSAQQSAIAQALAGKRQYNNLLALFDNWDMYTEALETSKNATGTLQKQQDIYMESTEAHLQQLKTEWEDFYDSIIDTSSINKTFDLLTAGLDKITFLIDSIGGGGNTLMTLFGVLTKIPGITTSISSKLSDIMIKSENAKRNAQEWSQWQQRVRDTLPSSEYTDILNKVEQYKSILESADRAQITSYVEQLKMLNDKKAEEQKILDIILEQQKAVSQIVADQNPTEGKIQENNKKIQGIDYTTKGFFSQEDFNNINETFDIQKENYQGLEVAVNKYQSALETLVKSEARMQEIEQKGTSITNEEIEEYLKLDDAVKKAGSDMKNAFQEAQDSLKVVASANKSEAQKLENSFKQTSQAAENLLAAPTNEIPGALKQCEDAVLQYKQTSVDSLGAINTGITENEQKFKQASQGIVESSQKINEARSKWNEFLDDAKIKAFSQGIVQLTGGISSLVSSLTTLSNLKNIIDNDDLTKGEKARQIIGSLAIGISMLVSSLGQMRTGFEKMIAPLVANIAFQKELINAEGKATATGLKYITAKENEKIATDKLTIALIREKIAALKADAALAPLLITIGLTVAAIAALSAVIIINVKRHEEAIETIKTENDNIIKLNQAKNEELEKNKELADSYKDLIDKYKEASISQKEFLSKKSELLAQMDAESRVAFNTASNWKEALQAYDNYTAKIADEEKANSKKSENSAYKQLLAEGDDGRGYYNSSTGIYSLDAITIFNNPSVQHKSFQNVASAMEEQGYDIGDITSTDEDGWVTLKFDSNSEEDLESFKVFLQIIQDLQDQGKEVPELWANEVDDLINSDAYQTFITEGENVLTQAEIGAGKRSKISQAETLEEGKKAYESFIEELTTTEGYTMDQAKEAWLKYIGSIGTDVTEELVQTQTNIDTMMDGFSKFYGDKAPMQEYFEGIHQSLIESGLTADDIANSGITKEEWMKFYYGKVSVEEIANQIKDNLNKSFQQGFANFKASAGDITNSMQSLITEAIDGSVDTSEDSVYQSLKQNIEDLIGYYPELTEQARIFNNEALIGTEQWTQAVYDLQGAFDALELDSLVDNYSSAMDKLETRLSHIGEKRVEYDDKGFLKENTETITFEAEMGPLTEDLKAIMDTDYSINVEVHADIEDDFNNLVSSMENMDSMAEKIGENFIVSAEDITEVAAAYPGILEGYTDLGNGTIQLNADIAQSAMDAASTAEIASTEELKHKIEDTNAELQLKKNHYQAIIDIVSNASTTEEGLEKAVSDVRTELDEIDQINSNKVANNETENASTVANDSQMQAAIVSNNWNEAYQNMATSSYEATQIAIENAKQLKDANEQAANGEEVTAQAVTKDVKVNFTGESSSQTKIDTDLDLKDSSEVTDNQAYLDEIKEYAQQQINAIDTEMAANEALMVEAAARLGKSVTTNEETGKSSTDDSSSGSSSSEDESETEEYLEREEDLYKQINEQLEEVESTLGRIQTIDEHSWGVNSKKALEEENELLKTQMELYEQKSETQQSELADKRAELEAQGITFSEDGSVMTNTEETLDELYEEYNAMVDVYNAMTASEQETYKETLEAKQDTIDEIEEAIDDYESAYSDYNDTLDKLLDTHYEIIENEVKQFTAEVEVHLELAEARNEWVDFWYDVVEDVEDTDFGKLIAKSMEKLDTYIGQEGTILALTNEADIGIDEVQKQIANAASAGGDSIFGDDSALSKETLETIRDNLIDAVTSAKEEIDNIKESILDAYDDMGDKIEEQAEGWKTVGDQLEHNLEVIKLIDGESAYGELNNQYEQIKQNDLELADWWSKQVTRYSADIQKYQDLLNATASTDPMYRVYSDLLDKATEKYKDAVSNVNETVESSIKHLQDLRDNTVNQALDKLDKSLSNNMGLDSMKDQWDLAIERQDYFLDNVERSLAMDEIEDEFKTIFEGIDTTSSKYQDLLKFQDEEIAKLNQKNKLTQYDIDELKARLEIKKQELALEEAQQNKSNLRLRRDSQGNYTYQYTADEDAVDEAEKNLLTARRDWYELVKQRNEDVTEEVYDIRKRLVEKTEELSQAEADKDEARAEYLRKEIKELADYEFELTQEGQKARQDFYKGTADFFADVDNNSILPMWDTTMSNMIDDWNDGTEASFVGAVQAGINEIDAAHAQYAQDVETLMTAAGRTMEDYRNNGIDPTTESLQGLQESNDEVNESLDETETLIEELTTELDNAMDAYESLEDTAVKSIEEINKTLKTLSETVITAVDNAKDLEEAYENAAAAGEKAATASSNSSSSGSSSGTGGNSSSTTPSTTTKTSSNNQKYVVGAAQGGDPNEWGVYAVTNNGNRKQFVENGTAEWIKQRYGDIFTFKTYKTGGYTGEWNNGSDENNGKLAFLHQKELVLNESDTSNILNAVNSVRDLVKNSNMNFGGIANSIASINAGQIQALSQISANGLRNIASMVSNETNNQGVSNTVINADFSGVRSADAIYQALIELENYGAQQAYSSAPSANNRY